LQPARPQTVLQHGRWAWSCAPGGRSISRHVTSRVVRTPAPVATACPFTLAERCPGVHAGLHMLAARLILQRAPSGNWRCCTLHYSNGRARLCEPCRQSALAPPPSSFTLATGTPGAIGARASRTRRRETTSRQAPG